MKFTTFLICNVIKNKIDLNLNVDKELQEFELHSDRGRVKQILLNLISNSYKFTFNGSISIIAKMINELDKSFVEFSVQDTGIGIKEEDQSKLFSLFGMVSSTSNLNPNGCGIGLTVSKKYVEKLGGTIKLKSVFNVGTVITFTIKSHSEGKLPDVLLLKVANFY